MDSPHRSPPQDAAEHPNPLASETLAPNEEPIPSPPPSPLRLTYYPENPSPSPPRDASEKPPSPSPPAVVESGLTIGNLLAREDPSAETVKAVGVGSGVKRWRRPVPAVVWRKDVRMAAVGLRVSAMVLSLVSFSIMSADKTQGWDGDFFARYDEYRYSLVVNVMACAYSGFQVYAEVYRTITGSHIIGRPLGYHLDFTMDQASQSLVKGFLCQRPCQSPILAYLSMSSSSAAASRNGIWVTRFGADDFTKMIDASVAMSFLAFATLALSSVISAYNIFRGKS
ncbi:CASP-like protein 4A3 isoform X1 [Typha angustifolia]|uniref:CASP-like protein 4A3 isoform X1 n=1 Tax=Typha angustifolia TaxID=59011 RepID=UPI003C2AAF46